MTHAIPDFALDMDGEDLRGGAFALPNPIDLTPQVRPRLVSLTLTDKRDAEADQLDLVLDDSDGRLALPRKGAVLRLRLGWRVGGPMGLAAGALVDKGSYVVDEVEWRGPPDQVTIRARSSAVGADFGKRRERSWRDTTLGDIAREVAAANRLEPRIDPDLARIPVAVLAQHQTSDMQLLRRIGREHDAVAQVKQGRLILARVGRGATASGATLRRVGIARSDCSDYAYREVDRQAEGGVEARWHDTDAAERKSVVVGEGSGTPRRLRRTYHSEASARAAAQAEASRAKRAQVELDITLALGRPDWTPERPAVLIGFRPEVDARGWRIVELVHTLDGALTSKVKLESV